MWLWLVVLASKKKPTVCACARTCVFAFSSSVFLDNLVLFLLSAEKCWRSQKPSGWSGKERRWERESDEYWLAFVCLALHSEAS